MSPLPGWFGKFLERAKSGSFQKRHQINRSLNGGEAVIGDDENIGAFAQLSFSSALRISARQLSERLSAAMDSGDPGAVLCSM